MREVALGDGPGVHYNSAAFLCYEVTISVLGVCILIMCGV